MAGGFALCADVTDAVVRRIVPALIFVFAGCGDELTDPNGEVTRVRGIVISAATQAPIAGASVELSLGPGIIPDLGVVTTTTNAAGEYSLERNACGTGLFIAVHAAGFQPAFAEELRCTTEVQVFNFALLPL